MKKLLGMAIAVCIILTCAVSAFAAGPVGTLDLLATHSGATYRPGEIVTLSADFKGVTGTISKVQFFEGEEVVGEASEGTDGVYTINYRVLNTASLTAKALGEDEGVLATTEAVVVNAKFEKEGTKTEYVIPLDATNTTGIFYGNEITTTNGKVDVTVIDNWFGKNNLNLTGKIKFKFTLNITEATQHASNNYVRKFRIKDASTWYDIFSIANNAAIFRGGYSSSSTANQVGQITKNADHNFEATIDLNTGVLNLVVDGKTLISNYKLLSAPVTKVTEWRMIGAKKYSSSATVDGVHNYYSNISHTMIVEDTDMPDISVVNADVLKDNGKYVSAKEHIYNCRITPSAVVYNKGEADKTVTFYAALFTENGSVLQSIQCIPMVSCPAGKAIEIKAPQFISYSTYGDTIMKIFAWDGADGITPFRTYGNVDMVYGE